MVRSIRHAWLAAGACALLATACARGGVSPRSGPAVRGVAFTIRTVSSSDTSFGGESSADSVSAQFLDGVLRFDVPGAPDPGSVDRAAPGPYVLMNGTARTAIIVMPALKRYWELRLDSAVSRRARNAPPAVISDLEVSGGRVGRGEIVNGFTTKRYRITTRYTETPSATSRRERRKRVHLVEDLWVADALTDIPDPFQVAIDAFAPLGARFETIFEPYAKRAAARRQLFEGLPVRTMSLTTYAFDDGTKAFKASTADVVDLKRASLDPASFRPPDGYAPIDVAALFENAAELLRKGFEGLMKDGPKKP